MSADSSEWPSLAPKTFVADLCGGDRPRRSQEGRLRTWVQGVVVGVRDSKVALDDSTGVALLDCGQVEGGVTEKVRVGSLVAAVGSTKDRASQHCDIFVHQLFVLDGDPNQETAWMLHAVTLQMKNRARDP